MNPTEQGGSGSAVPSGTVQAPRQGGLVTLLFTDLVGSTALKQQLGDRPGVALVHEHHALVRQLLKQFPEGEEISTAGDSFFLVFTQPSAAVHFALLVQSRLQRFNEGRDVQLHDRIGLHLGEVLIEETTPGKRDLHGIQVDTCARVMSLAHTGQILMTARCSITRGSH
jgi:adenylate cyclase